MKNSILICVLVLLVFIGLSCSGDSEETPSLPPTTPTIPAAASLVFPENNTECNEGIIRSATESTVNFRWEAAENADSYQVNLRDLRTEEVRLLNSTTTNLDITILRGNPYAWSVISRSNSNSATTESEVFQFYNAGEPLANFTPFPAEAIHPRIGSSLPQGSIGLEWNASDIDNDISSYRVFLSTENPPTTQIAETTASTTSITINTPGVYFWTITTMDSQGNASQSQSFQFRIN
ncbi:hypothetical protein [Spongiimicrobium salis]|uniref:hypothetical protein n=1 Tax=Spongiimicrobium salis TaxID=1667022 RepID=UPI00374D4292